MKRYLPVLTLFILSPLVAEVLFGATPLSNLGALLVVAPLYGGGAILVRELARRRSPGWGRIILMGAAYGIVEEGLAIQSLFNPNLFNAGLLGGRALGVNWPWSQWTIGYHVVWSIAIPILLAELLFPTRRAEPWLGRAGLIFVGVLFTLGTLGLAAIFRFAVAPDFKAPLILNLIAALVAIVLVILALIWPARNVQQISEESTGNVPNPWIVGLLGLLMAALWFGLLDLPHPLRRVAWVLVPMIFDAALIAGFAFLIRRWSDYKAWSDLHRLALVFGPLIISTLSGIFRVTAANRLDQLGLSFFGMIAFILLALFAQRLIHRGHEAEPIK
jgi:hypothetical protein